MACAATIDYVSGNVTTLTLKGLHPQSDADLLSLAAKRHHPSFATLVQRYHPQVFRVVWRVTNGHADAEDIAQEAFLRLWRDPGQVRNASALKGWLMRVANNLAMDRFRLKPTRDLETVAEVADSRPTAEASITRNWATTRVDQAVAQLPERQKLALTLVHFEQMSNIAAAAIMEITVDALESLLARARRSLKDHLAADKDLLLATLQDEGN